ncbi:MAG: proline--tRNA ligase [Caldicoprobacterales bacterium]|jgi:prolyl-tRNA synthetase|nr:proline--tRNA ligase [Clostridiales bacterium]
MLLSKLLGERFKEKPAEAFMASHIFMLRGGYVRQVSNGIFSLLPPAVKVSQKIEKIIREEMDAIDGQEVLFPVVLPAELWQESGRFDSVGSELVRFKDRNGRDMVLGMTHEEAAVHLARGEAHSYSRYPFVIYQIQTKFRDEPRARGGLIRVREFTMKDAYSFHTSQEDLEEYYQRAMEAYYRIFERAGLSKVISIQSDSGMMGGRIAHEFMYLSDGGEDTIVYCQGCDYKSNMEVAVSNIRKEEAQEEEIREVHTPGVMDIEALAEFLNREKSRTLKAAAFFRRDNEKPVLVFLRGDLQVNETKLRKILGTEAFPLTEHDGVDLCFGYIGPYNLNAENIEIIYDRSLEGESNLACGANKTDYHLTGLNVSRDMKIDRFVDVAKVNEGDACVHCGSPLKVSRGIEIGNIFQLGTYYSGSMGMQYLDEKGKLQTPTMGCYGIGVGRLLACIIEDNHDEYGPIWPKAVAPWLIHICVLNQSQPEVWGLASELYETLKKDWEVLLDDRGESAGVQFADADLLGAPVRIILSKRNVSGGQVEIVTRDKKIKKLVPIDEIRQAVEELLSQVK